MRDAATASSGRTMVHATSHSPPMSSLTDQPASDPDRNPAVAARVEQLYASHAALVRSVCRSLLRDRSEAEDAVQQTFLSAQRALVNGSSPRDEAAWLATIARHECLARVRARMREPLPLELELEMGDAGSDAHTAAVRRHEAVELREALAELPAQQRAAILLREVRGLSYQEVASSLSVTTAAVESLLFRARRSLQTRLREALAAVSPVGWLRDQLDGGLAGPAAAKVAAVGVGTLCRNRRRGRRTDGHRARSCSDAEDQRAGAFRAAAGSARRCVQRNDLGHGGATTDRRRGRVPPTSPQDEPKAATPARRRRSPTGRALPTPTEHEDSTAPARLEGCRSDPRARQPTAGRLRTGPTARGDGASDDGSNDSGPGD